MSERVKYGQLGYLNPHRKKCPHCKRLLGWEYGTHPGPGLACHPREGRPKPWNHGYDPNEVFCEFLIPATSEQLAKIRADLKEFWNEPWRQRGLIVSDPVPPTQSNPHGHGGANPCG